MNLFQRKVIQGRFFSIIKKQQNRFIYILNTVGLQCHQLCENSHLKWLTLSLHANGHSTNDAWNLLRYKSCLLNILPVWNLSIDHKNLHNIRTVISIGNIHMIYGTYTYIFTVKWQQVKSNTLSFPNESVLKIACIKCLTPRFVFRNRSFGVDQVEWKFFLHLNLSQNHCIDIAHSFILLQYLYVSQGRLI